MISSGILISISLLLLIAREIFKLSLQGNRLTQEILRILRTWTIFTLISCNLHGTISGTNGSVFLCQLIKRIKVYHFEKLYLKKI